METNIVKQYKLLFEMIGDSMDQVQAEKKKARRNGVIMRIVIIALTMLVTISSGIKWDDSLKYLPLILAAILTAVASIEGLLMFLERYYSLDDHLIELTVLYTDMGLFQEGTPSNADEVQKAYDSYKSRLYEINDKFHKSRVRPNFNKPS